VAGRRRAQVHVSACIAGVADHRQCEKTGTCVQTANSDIDEILIGLSAFRFRTLAEGPGGCVRAGRSIAGQIGQGTHIVPVGAAHFAKLARIPPGGACQAFS
jgi:hypothetical protein